MEIAERKAATKARLAEPVVPPPPPKPSPVPRNLFRPKPGTIIDPDGALDGLYRFDPFFHASAAINIVTMLRARRLLPSGSPQVPQVPPR